MVPKEASRYLLERSQGGKGSRTYSVKVERQLAFKCAHAPVLHMHGGHPEKGREFCIRTETRRCDRDCSTPPGGQPSTPQSNLPLVKGSLVHQVGGVVGAGEGIVHRLVLHDNCAVIGNNVAVEVVDGWFVLGEGRKKVVRWPWAPRKGRRALGNVGKDGSEKSPLGRHECLPLIVKFIPFLCG